jgi:hypothetical protein
MKNVSDKVAEKIETRSIMSTIPPPQKNAIYEIIWKNDAEGCRPHMTIWCM